MVRILSCAAFALALGGCAGAFCGVRVYQPLVVKSAAPGAALLGAAERAVRELGAETVEVAREESRLSAVFHQANGVREHLRLQVTDWGEVAIDLRTELQTDDGEWIAPTTVCDDYSHAREKRVAEHLLRLLANS
jgi:hypothetical protein